MARTVMNAARRATMVPAVWPFVRGVASDSLWGTKAADAACAVWKYRAPVGTVIRSSAPSTKPERLTVIDVAPAGISSGDVAGLVGTAGAPKARTVPSAAPGWGNRSGAPGPPPPGLCAGRGGPDAAPT